MNPQQLRDLDRYLTTPPDWDEPTDDGWCEMDEQPDPTPAAPTYDVDLPDSEWDGVPVVSVAMALDVLRSGRTLMCQCGPLQVTLTPQGDNVLFDAWNTETSSNVNVLIGLASAVAVMPAYLHTFGHVADGDWHVHCPDEPDGAPRW